ncbi:major facilitator superfamily domain-containing protein 6-like isoform X2 [Stegodyphus dumicola]|nr:major facilitator superfamily domain-containing protein 6-like isoform X2 [Stegodyphus dumicola]XP_035226348.1 major facilitator superfamily domain-containing protein 6-like isoform X2 [Stegodyphus dumicola]
MKELGLTVEDTTIIYTLLPITQVLFSPVAGFVADKLRRYRNVLLFFLIMTTLLAVAMMYVPAIEKKYHEPSIITILCDAENLVIGSCKKFFKNNTSENVMYLESCHFKCNKAEQFINITWPVAIYRTNFLRECEYNVTSICALTTTILPSNCSIICRELNAVANVPSQTTRKGFYLTFTLYAVLRIAYNIVTVTASTLVNSSAIALTETKAEVGEYGKQRFWAMFALAIFSPLAGILIDIISVDDGKTNYAPAFHIHNGLICMATVAAWFVDFEMEDKPPGYIETFKNVWKLLKFPSVFVFIIVIFWLGTVWGFLETFLFWFSQELGSPAYLMGLTITVGSLSSLPFLYYAKFFVSKIGYANLVSFGALMYMIRCVGCSFLINPWWIMPFEAMEIFTYHLLWVTAVTYAAHISPPGLLATIQGFLDSLHFGVGQGSGSLIGGSLISILG